MNDGKKRKAPKHKNKTAFKIQFDQLSLNIHKKVSLALLCKRCTEQMNWKLQFNKYKKITEAGKCNFCLDKVVVRSYMRACDPCAQKQGVCPKCLTKDGELPEDQLTPQEQVAKDKEQEEALNKYVDSLKLRSKNKVKRQFMKGIITWDQDQQCFLDKEGQPLVGLKFKTKGMDDLCKQFQDEFNADQDNWDDDDEESEEGEEERDDLVVQGKKIKTGEPKKDGEQEQEDENFDQDEGDV